MKQSGFSEVCTYESEFEITYHQNVLSVNLILKCNSHYIA